jgi:outer membrane protein insertion porin family
MPGHVRAEGDSPRGLRRVLGRAGLSATRVIPCVLLVFVALSQATAQTPTVTEVRIEQEGQVVSDAAVTGLVETKVGQPFSMREVRETIAHLVGLNRFDDVRVFQQPVSGGVAVRYELLPLHPVDRVVFRGDLGLSERDLRRVVTDQFGDPPRAAQSAAVADAIRRTYRERGYSSAEVSTSLEETHNPDRASLVVVATAGARVRIDDVRFGYVTSGDAGRVTEGPDVRAGQPYDSTVVQRELQRWETRMRARGYYQARATHGVSFPPGGAFVSVSLALGPLVNVAFTGDGLPAAERERLVPVRAEASADEDLLEDSVRAIQGYLQERGYRDAHADYSRQEGDGRLTVTFNVTRGPRYTVGDLQMTGQAVIPVNELRALVRVKPGDVFVQSVLDVGITSILNAYRMRGYTDPRIQRQLAVLVPENPADPTRRVSVALAIAEGPRTLVRSVAFQGNVAIVEADLQRLLVMQPGRPFSDADVATDRDRLDLEYRNRGHDRVTVTPSAMRVDEGRGADVRFAIDEGPRVTIDRVIISGHRRTNPATIERELRIRPGDPLGFSNLVESRSRVAALGLFRRVEIQEIRHASEPRVDLIVRVEEARPTTIGGGGGLEFSSRARTNDAGQAEDRYELAPRGFFEVGRRNLWGTNRAVNLFTRISLRSRDEVAGQGGAPVADLQRQGRYGFNEYRVVGTFREPRAAGTSADVLVTGILEQAIRSSFNFARREARAEAGLRLSPVYNVSGRYSFERTELFDEKLLPDEQPRIDRLFPQVRLSTFTASLLRDTRDDVLDASLGRLLLVESDLSARALGSEVGFAKTFLQGSSYHRLPGARRVVVAVNGRLGLAQGFPREVSRIDATGAEVVEVVEDLPASERFFAGGDTTVRGFSLDRLGDDATISASGFPTGGNGLIVLNGELRVGVVGALQGVAFLDAGNVVKRVGDLGLTNLRTAAGFGIRYGSPFGPIRLDWGFKLDRRELSPGRLERGSRIHISLGQAF